MFPSAQSSCPTRLIPAEAPLTSLVRVQAPRIALERWGSLDDSEWNLQWSPSWSMQVAVEGQYYVQFKCLVCVSNLKARAPTRGPPRVSRESHEEQWSDGDCAPLSSSQLFSFLFLSLLLTPPLPAPRQVSGRLRLRTNTDLSTIVLSFLELPRFSLKAECSATTVTSPIVPQPLMVLGLRRCLLIPLCLRLLSPVTACGQISMLRWPRRHCGRRQHLTPGLL